MIELATAGVLLDAQRSDAKLLIDNFWDGSSENTFRLADARMATSYCAYPFDREVGALAASLIGSSNEMLVEIATGPGSSVDILAQAAEHPSGHDDGSSGESCRDWIRGSSPPWASTIPVGHQCFAGNSFRGHNHSESGEFDFANSTQSETWGEHEYCWLAMRADLYFEASEDQVTSLINFVGQDIFGLQDQGDPLPLDQSLVFATGVASLYDQAGMSRYPGSDHERWEAFSESSDGSLVRLGNSSEIAAKLWRMARPFELQGLSPRELLAQLQATPERQYDVPIIGATLRASYALAAILLLAVFPLTFLSNFDRGEVRDWFSVGFPASVLLAGAMHLTVAGASWSGTVVGIALTFGTVLCAIRLRGLLRQAS
ncbi:hypothetical protein ILP92_16835 [Maribius pontilimi]|uniref:Uncharacterized protein n=1 Tax=Palleronia pontilimi TaxID=1964209 RepID=A0A934IC28_9RHOB|nr:hypothetical protein [Palleronia pontilimi]MBJ3764408.1 hypothetical protein [Palleronia pontilimi]